MTEEEKQARLAELKNIPQQVQRAAMFAMALGLVSFLRVLARAYANHLSIGRAFLTGALLGIWFFLNGACLYNRSRWSYAGLIGFALLPTLGLITLWMHLLTIALQGNLLSDWPNTLLCLIAVLQIAVTAVLLRYLLAKQVRDYIWKPPTQ